MTLIRYHPFLVGNGANAEYGDHFEGDMILNDEQLDALTSNTRNGLVSHQYRWPNKTIPYRLSKNHSKVQHDYIQLALETLESVSCIRFVQHTNERDYIHMSVI